MLRLTRRPCRVAGFVLRRNSPHQTATCTVQPRQPAPRTRPPGAARLGTAHSQEQRAIPPTLRQAPHSASTRSTELSTLQRQLERKRGGPSRLRHAAGLTFVDADCEFATRKVRGAGGVRGSRVGLCRTREGQGRWGTPRIKKEQGQSAITTSPEPYGSSSRRWPRPCPPSRRTSRRPVRGTERGKRARDAFPGPSRLAEGCIG